MFESIILGAHLLTAHVPGAYCSGVSLRCQDYERTTPGLYAIAPSGVTFGAYRNSYGAGSVYAGWSFQTADRRFALLVAVATGYRRALPLVVPSWRQPITENGSVRLSFMPKVEKGGASALHLSYEFQL